MTRKTNLSSAEPEQDKMEKERQRQENLFNTLPGSLVRPCVVRSKVSYRIIMNYYYYFYYNV